MAGDDDPFGPYVQELQGQEGDIEKKIEIIKDVIKDITLVGDPRDFLDEVPDRLAGLKKKIAEKKIEDLETEFKDLEELIQNPEKFVPPEPQIDFGPIPPWWPPGWPWPPFWLPPGGGSSSSTSSSSSGSSSGAVDAEKMKPASASTVTIGTKERDFIVARSRTTVWVWQPADLKWVAQLDTGGEIVELAKVDGTIAVRTVDSLWLFNPLKYEWMGKLDATIEEVAAHTLAVPAVVKKES
jgi:hypothetical protein